MVTTAPTNGKLHRAEPPELSDDDSDLTIPPHSSQAEEAVLGSVLKRGLAIADVVPFLKPQHFYETRNRHVYAAMTALFERAAAIDYHTLAEELARQGTYEPAGGLLYLSELNLSTPSAAHIEHYARIVLEHWCNSIAIGPTAPTSDPSCPTYANQASWRTRPIRCSACTAMRSTIPTATIADLPS